MSKGICISGGGCKGAYITGVLQYLLGDLKREYDLVAGISVGSLIASSLMHFKHGEEQESAKYLLDLWTNLTTDKVYKRWQPFGVLQGFFKSSVYDSSPLSNLMHDLVKPEYIKSSGKRLRIGAVSLTTGKYKTFDENYPDIISAIVASASFPIAFSPVKLENELWSDGGLRNMTPLKATMADDIDEIDVIITSPKGVKSGFTNAPKVIDILPRIIDILFSEIVDNDVYLATQINDLILAGAIIPGKKYIKINIIRPEEDLPGSTLKFDHESILQMIDIGYATAKKQFKL